MRFLSTVVLLVCSAAFGFSQDERNDTTACSSTPAATVGHEADVIVQKVAFTGEWGRDEVTVYLPRNVAQSAVLFSHSAIHADSGESADLRLFALKLAQAGAAVVVPQRTLIWPPVGRSTNRAGAPVICAHRWLVDHVKVVKNAEPDTVERGILRHRYAYVGPRLCDPVAVADCRYTMPDKWDCVSRKRHCPTPLWIPVGETEGGDSTLSILSGEALQSAQWWLELERRLYLAPIAATVSPAPQPGS